MLVAALLLPAVLIGGAVHAMRLHRQAQDHGGMEPEGAGTGNKRGGGVHDATLWAAAVLRGELRRCDIADMQASVLRERSMQHRN